MRSTIRNPVATQAMARPELCNVDKRHCQIKSQLVPISHGARDDEGVAVPRLACVALPTIAPFRPPSVPRRLLVGARRRSAAWRRGRRSRHTNVGVASVSLTAAALVAILGRGSS
eukprot:9111239-Heterocapsa_arctica.AAC.1